MSRSDTDRVCVVWRHDRRPGMLKTLTYHDGSVRTYPPDAVDGRVLTSKHVTVETDAAMARALAPADGMMVIVPVRVLAPYTKDWRFSDVD